MKLKIKNYRKGFTLIEMMVVVFVLGIGLIGALSFFNINLNNQFEAKNELIAAGLAQEGADLVRNIKDYNQLNGNVWYYNICTDNKCGNKCRSIDLDSLSSHTCEKGGGKSYVKLDSITKTYLQCTNGDSDKTIFTRTVDISACDNSGCGGSRDLDTAGNYMKVTVTVKWNNDSRTTTAIDNLYSISY